MSTLTSSDGALRAEGDAGTDVLSAKGEYRVTHISTDQFWGWIIPASMPIWIPDGELQFGFDAEDLTAILDLLNQVEDE